MTENLSVLVKGILTLEDENKRLQEQNKILDQVNKDLFLFVSKFVTGNMQELKEMENKLKGGNIQS